MMAERGVSVAPSTILRRVKHYAPEFETRWDRFARPVGGSSRYRRQSLFPQSPHDTRTAAAHDHA
jgi:hypothetical protein